MRQIQMLLLAGLTSIGLAGGTGGLATANAQLARMSMEVTSVSEADVEIVATITRDGNVTGPLSVTLSSSDLTELRVPATVDIPDGASSAKVLFEVVNDGDIDGTQRVTVTLTAPEYADTLHAIEVRDDDTTGQHTVGGPLFGNIEPNTYRVVSSIQIEEGRTLRIAPGTRLHFEPATGLTIAGSFIARGQPEAKITFTNTTDDQQGASWLGIVFNGGEWTTLELEYANVAFAENGMEICPSQGTAQILVLDSIIHDNINYGISIKADIGIDLPLGTVQVANSTIYGNRVAGIRAESYSNECFDSTCRPLISHNDIYENGTFGTGISLVATNGGRACAGSITRSTISGKVVANWIHDNGRYGIIVKADTSHNQMVASPLIQGNLVTNNGSYGFSLSKSSGGILKPQIVGNTIIGHSLVGIRQSSDLDPGFAIVNNIIACNGSGVEAAHNVDPNGQKDALIKCNNVFDNIEGNWVNFPPEYGEATTVNAGGIPVDHMMNMSIDPCFARATCWNDNDTADLAWDDYFVEGDYHLKSQAGRWDPNSKSWVRDDVTSPCIDAGDPNANVADEVWPHGGRINMGAYGGTAQASMSVAPTEMFLPRVVYIHWWDREKAESFQSFLQAYGCTVTLLRSDQMTASDVEDCDLVMIDPDTQNPAAWPDQAVSAVTDAGTPILGLGPGGYRFFGKMGLTIGYPNGASNTFDSVQLVDPNSPLLDTPYAVAVPQDSVLTLYNVTEKGSVIYLWPAPDTVTTFASMFGDPGYFPLVAERGHFLWGFTESPEHMTAVGQRLFLNVIIRTANGLLEPARASTP